MSLPDGCVPMSERMVADDETAMTEIVLLPDGRVCLFGASLAILELLGDLQLGDGGLDARLAAARGSGSAVLPQRTETTS
jgi:hypothetical protein